MDPKNIETYLPLVNTIAGRMALTYRTICLDDMRQEGCIGLIKGITEWERNTGKHTLGKVTIDKYLAISISHAIIDWIRTYLSGNKYHSVSASYDIASYKSSLDAMRYDDGEQIILAIDRTLPYQSIMQEEDRLETEQIITDTCAMIRPYYARKHNLDDAGMQKLSRAIIELWLDRMTLLGIAAKLGIGFQLVYYVTGRFSALISADPRYKQYLKYKPYRACNKKTGTASKTKHRGVYWHKQNKSWYAVLYVDRRSVFIGAYPTPIQAYRARRDYIKSLIQDRPDRVLSKKEKIEEARAKDRRRYHDRDAWKQAERSKKAWQKRNKVKGITC